MIEKFYFNDTDIMKLWSNKTDINPKEVKINFEHQKDQNFGRDWYKLLLKKVLVLHLRKELKKVLMLHLKKELKKDLMLHLKKELKKVLMLHLKKKEL